MESSFYGTLQSNGSHSGSIATEEEEVEISLDKDDWFEVLEALSSDEKGKEIAQNIRRQLNHKINGSKGV